MSFPEIEEEGNKNGGIYKKEEQNAPKTAKNGQKKKVKN